MHDAEENCEFNIATTCFQCILDVLLSFQGYDFIRFAVKSPDGYILDIANIVWDVKGIAVWPTVIEALEALGTRYRPAMNQTAAELGLSRWYEGWLLPALMFEPDPISAMLLRRRSPFASPRLFNERLSMAVKQGSLAPIAKEENEYCLTEMGRQAAERV
jgi:hypothetical protein